ncbi:hypothetical protein COL52_29935 [Bacillus toyonensis]|uniref:hypothetical protein n=1 Tax=Bacillus toyonensis TaxID=155322 RepID=UPI000BF04D8A|nr:hypothetical protein [Bacillus toyonensis]PEK81672.1 hypothetical protein CN594_22620 [Bacillus toyonensis]PFY39700.1 hypothetical protein COL55_25085 [Bacillus toyonensis]PFY54002.1 hypothetical protein COL52_29935 [Bacillus toyonensis]PGD16915.1 hypothetical protein COM37_23445 [Bacillus toyonensis]PHA39358.1 hypothetical protein COE68_23665 [Bacillus toyonensis]
MARTLHTKVIMDSGKEYDLDVHPEDFMSRISNEKGELYKGFVHFFNLSINPLHVSSIETVEVKVDGSSGVTAKYVVEPFVTGIKRD